MQVRFFNPGLSYKKHKEELLDEIHQVLSNGDLILRKAVEEFEIKLCQYIGTKYAVGLNSGTDALFLALKALGIGKGDEVITVSNTFKSTITSIIHTGAKPILVDIGDNYLMNVDQVIKSITKKTKAIIPVHLSGDVCDLNKLWKIKYLYPHIKIIEDAAQALGAEFFMDDQASGVNYKVGKFADIACFSFYPAKILGAFGDAGAITTNDENIANEIKDLRNHYKDHPGGLGFNSRLDNLQAAILNVKFKYLDEFIQRRLQIAEMYNKALNEISNTHTFVLPNNNKNRVYQDYIVYCEKPIDLSSFLKEKGIETMIPPILPHQELKLKFKLPKSELYNQHFLRLPCNPDLEDEEVLYVIDCIKQYYANLQ